jgi:hypothetical protein
MITVALVVAALCGCRSGREDVLIDGHVAAPCLRHGDFIGEWHRRPSIRRATHPDV